MLYSPTSFFHQELASLLNVEGARGDLDAYGFLRLICNGPFSLPFHQTESRTRVLGWTASAMGICHQNGWLRHARYFSITLAMPLLKRTTAAQCCSKSILPGIIFQNSPLGRKLAVKASPWSSGGTSVAITMLSFGAPT